MECLFEDLAYLLGLTCGRGQLDYEKNKLTIEFSFKSVKSKGIFQTFNQRDKLIVAVDDIVNKLLDFTGTRIKKSNYENKVVITLLFSSSTHTWQYITSFFNKKISFYEFIIPKDFFTAPKNVKQSFLRGFSDVSGYIRESNRDQINRHRVYLEVPQTNWKLPIQICQLFQHEDIRIPVQMILWGHPNLRGKGNWAKEHQIRIYAEYFQKIGFSIGYKNLILKELADYNRENFRENIPKFCDPYQKKIRKKKISKDECSEILPKSIRDKHYDAFWQICCDLGCNKCKNK